MASQLIDDYIYSIKAIYFGTTDYKNTSNFWGQSVLDFNLSALYERETRKLRQAVNSNADRFPEYFMLLLTQVEWKGLITVCNNPPSTAKFT